MFKPFFLYVGYKYARSKRENHFISFISLTSMLGIALGVAVLITVLSVMNGFDKEIRAKILSFTSHIVLRSYNGALYDWQAVLPKVREFPGVASATPYILGHGLLVANGVVQPSIVHGMDPSLTDNAYPLKNNLTSGKLADLRAGGFGIVIGQRLAQSLDVGVADRLTLLIPEASMTIAGVTPKFKRLVIVGVYDTATHYDEHNIFINLSDAAKIYKMPNAVTGIQIQVDNELQAGAIAQQLSKELDHKYWLNDWGTQHANFLDALNMEKTVMWCILCLIIAVAAFNLVASLVMMVTDKRADIAILRTMGATPRSIVGIFMSQGMIIGVVGTLLGLIFGLLLAYNITPIVECIQNIFNVQFVAEDVYFVSFVPSQIRQLDIILVCVISILMCFIATLYPAWRAANIAPAEALRYE